MTGYGACRGAKAHWRRAKSQIRNPKRVKGLVPAEGLGVSPQFSLFFPKIGGSRGLKATIRTTLTGVEGIPGGGHSPHHDYGRLSFMNERPLYESVGNGRVA
jgi:hypothetical protein